MSTSTWARSTTTSNSFLKTFKHLKTKKRPRRQRRKNRRKQLKMRPKDLQTR